MLGGLSRPTKSQVAFRDLINIQENPLFAVSGSARAEIIHQYSSFHSHFVAVLIESSMVLLIFSGMRWVPGSMLARVRVPAGPLASTHIGPLGSLNGRKPTSHRCHPDWD